MNFRKKIIIISVLLFLINNSYAQVFFKKTSDSTWKFIGEYGLVTGSYTYDQFAPDFYLEGFQFQLKKGIYYHQENKNSSFRFSIILSNGKIDHEAKQYYEIKDTVNLNGRWMNTGIQIGFEKKLHENNLFTFYTGGDAIYRIHRFTGVGNSMFDDMPFQQTTNAYGIGTELFLGLRFHLCRKIILTTESAFSALLINDKSTRNYANSTIQSHLLSNRHTSIEPSPFNRICIGYKF